MLLTERYVDQLPLWPRSGNHISDQAVEESIIVDQAYASSIGRYAAKHGQFGGEFSYTHMSWIKPSFLWMMYRSGWGAMPGQEVTLAIRIRRSFFDDLISQAVPSSAVEGQFATQEDWLKAVRTF